MFRPAVMSFCWFENISHRALALTLERALEICHHFQSNMRYAGKSA